MSTVFGSSFLPPSLSLALLSPPLMTPDPNHPITDLDARFAAAIPGNTVRLVEALHLARLFLDVTINGPKDSPEEQAYDIFWFQKDDDMGVIGQILRDTIPSDSK